MHRDDFARIRRAEGDLPFDLAAVEKHGHEQGLAGEQPFAGAHEGSEETGVLLRAVSQDGFHIDVILHEHHAAGLGHDGLLGVQFDFDELHFVAKDLVIDFVHFVHTL